MEMGFVQLVEHLEKTLNFFEKFDKKVLQKYENGL